MIPLAGKTIAEKIFSAHSGTDARAGDIVVADVDFVTSAPALSPLDQQPPISHLVGIYVAAIAVMKGAFFLWTIVKSVFTLSVMTLFLMPLQSKKGIFGITPGEEGI